jgi:hypothetical protein
MEHLVHDGENLEVFLSRSVIRVTTPHFRKTLIIQAIEEALKGVEKRRLALGDLYPASLGKPNARKLQKWVQRNFDDASLQELGRLSGTSISRKSKHKVRDSLLLRGKLTKRRFSYPPLATNPTPCHQKMILPPVSCWHLEIFQIGLCINWPTINPTPAVLL